MPPSDSDRLGWRIEGLEHELEALKPLPQHIAIYDLRLQQIGSQVTECMERFEEQVARHERQTEEQRAEREKERKEREALRVVHDRERKKDRQWMLGSLIATAAVIVAAMGIFFG